jgi:hypothetical protein
LFASKERVAIGANFHVNVSDRGARFDNMAARAIDRCRFVLGMDAGFHKFLSTVSIYNTTLYALQLTRFHPPARSPTFAGVFS